jgi:hypothetical protein
MMEQTMAERNRKLAGKPKEPPAPLRITYPNAAGIDIGSASHFVAVPPDRDDSPVANLLVSLPICMPWPIGSPVAASIQ